jgi:peptidoglycan/LPS O-acetylase OafA/YrhL
MTGAMSVLRYRPELDGLRTVAVYLVVAYHADMVLLGGGFVGVDLFFVLSGFLVTSVLLHDLDSEDGLRLGRFYARRVRRLLPAALVVVVATACLQLLLLSLPSRIELVDDARASVLYVANWHFVADVGDYFAQDDAPSPFLHFWSLSIEEQFYIVFPLLVLAVARWSRRPRRALAAVLALLCAASAAAQVVTAGTDASLAYYGTHTRAYQLAAGGLLAVVLLSRRPGTRATAAPRWQAPATATLGVVGLVGVVVLATEHVDVSPSTRGLATTVAAAATIAGLWLAPRGWAARVLALPLPRYLGQVSYGTYLWHWPVTLLLQQVLDTRPTVIALLTALVATGLAALSFHVLETPIRSAKALHRVPWPVVGAGLATSVLVVVALPVALEHDARPAVAARPAGGPAVTSGPAWLDQPVPELDLVGAKDDVNRDEPPPCVADDPEACATVEGDGARVLVLGDSQADMFVPALEDLADERDWQLFVNVQNGCPWQADQVNARGTGAESEAQAEACRAARDTFLAEVLPAMDVDVVVAIGLSRSDRYWETRLTSPGSPPGESLADLQHRTTTLTADLVRDAGARLVIVHSLLGTDGYSLRGFDPIECLAAARTLGDCAVAAPRGRPSVDDTYVALATDRPDEVATIDLTPVFCPDWPVCRPVVDGTVVWKDRDHVTVTFLRERTDALLRRLRGTGFLD